MSNAADAFTPRRRAGIVPVGTIGKISWGGERPRWAPCLPFVSSPACLGARHSRPSRFGARLPGRPSASARPIASVPRSPASHRGGFRHAPGPPTRARSRASGAARRTHRDLSPMRGEPDRRSAGSGAASANQPRGLSARARPQTDPPPVPPDAFGEPVQSSAAQTEAMTFVPRRSSASGDRQSEAVVWECQDVVSNRKQSPRERSRKPSVIVPRLKRICGSAPPILLLFKIMYTANEIARWFQAPSSREWHRASRQFLPPRIGPRSPSRQRRIPRSERLGRLVPSGAEC